MPLINRNNHPSERRRDFQATLGAVATGVTSVLAVVPFNGLVTAVFGAAFGLSGTPTTSFSLYRLTSTGFTSIGLGATLTLPAFGTSGFSYYGSTINGNTISGIIGITALQGDLLVALSGGTNAAVTSAYLGGVIQPTDDFTRWP